MNERLPMAVVEENSSALRNNSTATIAHSSPRLTASVVTIDYGKRRKAEPVHRDMSNEARKSGAADLQQAR